jgi:hypothetical protein
MCIPKIVSMVVIDKQELKGFKTININIRLKEMTGV